MSFLYVHCKSITKESKRNGLLLSFLGHIKSKYIVETFLTKHFFQVTPLVKYAIAGFELEINYSLEELEVFQPAVLEILFQGIRNLKGGNNIVLEPCLEKRVFEFIPQDIVCTGDNMGILFLEKMLESIVKKKRLSKKNLRMVVVDGAYLTSLTLLLPLVKDLNYCTIVTKRALYFELFVDEIYEEYGLVIEIEDVPCNCRMHGQLVVDFQEGLARNPKWFSKESEVICFEQRYTPMGQNWSKWEYHYQKEIILPTWLELLFRDAKESFDDRKWAEIKENIDIRPAIGYNTVIVREN